jgi:enoyl-CoA hydratase/carnithine racemase
MTNVKHALDVAHDGPVLRLTLNRPAKRNALNNDLASQLEDALAKLDDEVRAIVIDAKGPHFCAGLDLSEQKDRDPLEVHKVSRRWHAIKDRLQCGPPVVASLHGAGIGGGFELAAVAHVRIADRSTYFQLPEARRGLFIGGGGSVRIGRLIGVSRMTELMLTGRSVDAEQAERIGLIHQLVPVGSADGAALETARSIAGNAPLVNYLIVQALPRIADMAAGDGLFTESLAASFSHVSSHAREGMEGFLNRPNVPGLSDGAHPLLTSPTVLGIGDEPV